MYDWKFFIIIYLVFSVIFNYSYKIVAKDYNNSGAITILIQILSSIFCLAFIPLFKIKYPKDIKVYIFLFLAIIFYTLNDRFGTIARSKLDASIYSVIKQLSTVFMIIFGIVFFEEEIALNKITGSVLIVVSNILVLYKKGKINKYIVFGFFASINLTIALLIDVNYSNEFNLAFYILLTLFIPAMLIFIFERIKFKDIFIEYKRCDKKALFLTSFSWVVMMISKLKAYSLGIVSIVAPISSLTVIITILVGYLFFNEKNNLIKKLISGIFILIGIILIKL